MVRKLVPDHIVRIVPYPPGKPLEELEREYGIKNSVKLASNENPLGPSPKATRAIERMLPNIHRYPDGSGYYLRRRISEKFDVPFEGVVLANGSNEIIELLIRTFLLPGDEVLFPEPSFLVYKLAAQAAGVSFKAIPLRRDFTIDLDAMLSAVTADTKIIFINNPNNPTGTILRSKEFENFLENLSSSGLIVALDEAYIEFVRNPEVACGFHYLSRRFPFIVVLRTFSKAYGLAGLRIGYGVMDPELADFMNRVRQPFNTGSVSQAAALAALDDDEFLDATRRTVWQGLQYLYHECRRLGLDFIPSEANFLLIRVPHNSQEIYEKMLKQGVIIRSMTAYGLPNYIRVNVGKEEENRRFIEALEKTLRQLARR